MGKRIFALPENEIYKRYSNEYVYEKLDCSILYKLNIKAAFYYYLSGDCCGAGAMIILMNDNNIYYHSLGHCSCYGPLESEDNEDIDLEIDLELLGNSWDQIIGKCSGDLYKELKPLVDLAKRKGY